MNPKIPILGWIVAYCQINRAHRAYAKVRKTKSAPECEQEYRATLEAFDRVNEAFGWTMGFLAVIVAFLFVARFLFEVIR